jgi:poly-gamma-glutamate system protein
LFSYCNCSGFEANDATADHISGPVLIRKSQTGHTTFSLVAKGKLLLLAVAMLGLWLMAAADGLNPGELQLWNKVTAAQQHLSQWKLQNGSAADTDADPWNCGLIGIEWSGITTTLGDLSAKRTACNPAWAIQFSRWFEQQGLKPGDPIAIYSSSSFPGLLLSAIVASEAMELDPLLIVSLGASTWGANNPDYPWPVLATELRRAGFIHKRADFYTLGGGSELGHELSPEGAELLHNAAINAGVELLTADNLNDMISLKTRLMESHQARLLLSIGGSHANMGDDYDVLRLHTGPVPVTDISVSGNGIIGYAMRGDIPVIHMLNLKHLSKMSGIPYDASPRKMAPTRVNAWMSGAGIILFFIVLIGHKRWRLV